jgi:hypothetical protein
VKWREDQEHPSEKDRWRRSKDLANSRARRVRAQVLGIQSHKDARSEKVITIGSGSWDDCWIQTWDHASKPREKNLEDLATKIAKSRVSDLGPWEST